MLVIDQSTAAKAARDRNSIDVMLFPFTEVSDSLLREIYSSELKSVARLEPTIYNRTELPIYNKAFRALS